MISNKNPQFYKKVTFFIVGNVAKINKIYVLCKKISLIETFLFYNYKNKNAKKGQKMTRQSNAH